MFTIDNINIDILCKVVSSMSKSKVRNGDLLWSTALLVWILVLAIPSARTVFLGVTDAHPYLGGFIKFACLATMGDLLGARILNGQWSIPNGFFYKAALWGLIGMAITLLFTVYSAGAEGAQAAGKLPFAGSTLAKAIFTSVIMNLTFGPMMYIYHKFGDIIIDMKLEKTKITVEALVNKVDWHSMVGFSWLKTCPLVWIPCHSLVFLLPGSYRVLASAFLSILLGILVAMSKKSSVNQTSSLADEKIHTVASINKGIA